MVKQDGKSKVWRVVMVTWMSCNWTGVDKIRSDIIILIQIFLIVLGSAPFVSFLGKVADKLEEWSSWGILLYNTPNSIVPTIFNLAYNVCIVSIYVRQRTRKSYRMQASHIFLLFYMKQSSALYCSLILEILQPHYIVKTTECI